ncbi:dentilisin complex serine proteinase subunit PrtP [Treponema sp. HNW]|uniref:dentilisin complex serine proteinase subunit PrtP n=1 Tax=Treponema sp. HNW TaxID=3116654 RepID=UPI003D098305
MKKNIIVLSGIILAAALLFFACSFGMIDSGTQTGFQNTNAPSDTAAPSSATDIVDGFIIAKTKSGFNANLFTEKGITVQSFITIAGTDSTYWYLYKEGANVEVLALVSSVKGVLSADYDYKVIPPQVQKNPITSASGLYEPVAGTQGLAQGNYSGDPVSDAQDYALEITKALEAYGDSSIGYGNNTVVAGIIDTGINMEHEDFKNGTESVVLYAKSAKTSNASPHAYIGDGNPFTEVPLGSDWDFNGHGTHCSGTICALGDNNKGIAGVAWKNTKLISYQSLGFSGGGSLWAVYGALADFTEIVAILRKDPASRTSTEKNKLPSYIRDTDFQITQKTVPVNMSLGGSVASEFAFDVLTAAVKNDILPVIAMGNEGRYTAAYPAAFPGVLAVGATNGRDKKARFSNKGAWISVAAPGENIVSCGSAGKSSYVSMSGTSMATPFVTGFISYLLSFDNARTLTPYQIKKLIENTADDKGDAGFDEDFGYGRVNVLKAAQAVVNNAVPAANDFYGEGAVTVTVKNKGVPVSEKITLCDKVTGVPLAYIGQNNRSQIVFRGLEKNKEYRIFASCAGETQQRDFTVSGTDQDIPIAFNKDAFFVSTVKNTAYNSGNDTPDIVITVFKADADGKFNENNLVLRSDRDALETVFFTPEANTAYYVLITGIMEGNTFKGGNYALKIGDGPLNFAGESVPDGSRTAAQNDSYEIDDNPFMARAKGNLWNQTLGCNLVPGTNQSGQVIPDFDWFVIPASSAVPLAKPAQPSLAPSTQGLKASWTAEPGAQHYGVYLFKGTGLAGFKLVKAPLTEAFFPGYDNTKSYTVKVQALGNLTSKSDSPMSDASLSAQPYPPFPSVTGVTAVPDLYPDWINVAWTSPAGVNLRDISEYKVSIIKPSDGSVVKEETVFRTSNTFYNVPKGTYKAEVIIIPSTSNYGPSRPAYSSFFTVN